MVDRDYGWILIAILGAVYLIPCRSQFPLAPSSSKTHIVQAEILLKHLQMLEQVDLPRIYSGSQNRMNFIRWEFMFLKYTGLQGSNGDMDIRKTCGYQRGRRGWAKLRE